MYVWDMVYWSKLVVFNNLFIIQYSAWVRSVYLGQRTSCMWHTEPGGIYACLPCHYLQVGALFSLSCVITAVAQPAANQLSSQRWRESVARRPKSLPSKMLFVRLFYLITSFPGTKTLTTKRSHIFFCGENGYVLGLRWRRERREWINWKNWHVGGKSSSVKTTFLLHVLTLHVPSSPCLFSSAWSRGERWKRSLLPFDPRRGQHRVWSLQGQDVAFKQPDKWSGCHGNHYQFSERELLVIIRHSIFCYPVCARACCRYSEYVFITLRLLPALERSIVVHPSPSPRASPVATVSLTASEPLLPCNYISIAL